MVGANVHPKVIQNRLGHSSITVTLDTYGHLLPSLDEEVADSLEAIHLAASS
jgi:integrase